MKVFWWFFFAAFFSSCIDITDELLITRAGSGVFQRTTDYTKVFENITNEEDSLAMVKQAESDHQNLVAKFKATEGIHNINYTRIYGTNKYRVGFEFNSLKNLNTALLEPGIPDLYVKERKAFKVTGGAAGLRNTGLLDTSSSDFKTMTEMVNKGTYTFIFIAPKKVKKSSNKKVEINKNNMIYKTSLADLLLDQTINEMSIYYK